MKAHALYDVDRRPQQGQDAQEDKQDLLHRLFVPRQETQVVAAQQTKGLFLPYPLLGILVTVGALVLSGIVGLYVQVSSLNTTLLLRDADTQRALTQQAEKIEQLEVYLHDMREKRIADRKDIETLQDKRRQ